MYVFSTHLSVANSQDRVAQANCLNFRVFDIMQRDRDNKVLLGGDFNSYYDSAELRLLRSGPGNRSLLNGAFQVLQCPAPKFTCWAGTTIDHMFVDRNLESHVVGGYVYMTLTSNHIPVIIDLNVRPKK